MSMIENLKSFQENGIETFLDKEREKWSCLKCGEQGVVITDYV